MTSAVPRVNRRRKWLTATTTPLLQAASLCPIEPLMRSREGLQVTARRDSRYDSCREAEKAFPAAGRLCD